MSGCGRDLGRVCGGAAADGVGITDASGVGTAGPQLRDVRVVQVVLLGLGQRLRLLHDREAGQPEGERTGREHGHGHQLVTTDLDGDDDVDHDQQQGTEQCRVADGQRLPATRLVDVHPILHEVRAEDGQDDHGDHEGEGALVRGGGVDEIDEMHGNLSRRLRCSRRIVDALFWFYGWIVTLTRAVPLRSLQSSPNERLTSSPARAWTSVPPSAMTSWLIQ